MVSHLSNKNKEFKAFFFIPNQMCRFRVNTFSEKEPEILDWIDEFGEKGVFFDIGANIGLYSIYFAKMNTNSIAYAFEPSVFNLAQIAKNISINSLQDKINLISNPLSKSRSISRFIISEDDEGGALNAFGVEYGQDGKKIHKSIDFNTLGFSIDFMFDNKILNQLPTMIKIDVDGIEDLILEGARKTIQNPTCKTIFVEINKDFDSQLKNIKRILSQCGFSLDKELHSQMIKDNPETRKSFNQIWFKN